MFSSDELSKQTQHRPMTLIEAVPVICTPAIIVCQEGQLSLT